MRWMVVAVAIGAAPVAAAAQDMRSMQVAVSLGTILAAEEMCGLTYDLDAVDRFIDENVPADDMNFPSTLQMMTGGSRAQQEDMGEAARRAHCRQVMRSARAAGFIE